jgi:uncharacterized repeat protein (TIGR02543 family)
MSPKKFAVTLAIALLAFTLISIMLPQASATATSKVNITFTATGYGTCSGDLITITEIPKTGTPQTYTYTAGSPKVLSLKSGDAYTVSAATPKTGSDGNIYAFNSWTNGDGLSGASGTFTVPTCDTVVTANYAKSTAEVCFRTSGLSNLNSGVTVLTIDGTAYDYWQVQNTNFKWLKGSTHSITAVGSITGWDKVKHDFSGWTNGITSASGTFTTPNSDVTVTANYQVSSTTSYTATFAASGFAGTNYNIIKIDGETIAYGDLSGKSFLWAAGSTHTIQALGPVYDYSTPAKGYTFSSWTNGDGLSGASGTFTMPAQNVKVTANYVQSTVQVTFSTSGLGSSTHMNAGATILTIDGTPYDYWGIINFKQQWTKGSTHTVTAVGSITGSDNVKHDFSSWTNGDGLTSNSGTYTTPNCDVAVTANYVTSTSPTASSSITVSCTNGTSENTLTIAGTLTSGSSGLSGKTVTLTYYDGVAWQSIGQTTTGCNGAYSYTWTVPTQMATGVYPLKASYAGDSCYQASNASGELTFYGMHLVVLPESLGSIVALVACFGGAVVFFKLRSKSGAKA